MQAPSSLGLQTRQTLNPWGAPVVKGLFLRRYKRFFVDVLIGADVVTAHTSNTGAMTGMLVPDAPVLLTNNDQGKRAYPLELEAVDVGTSWICCNTIRSNRVAEAFLRAGIFPELGAFSEIDREVQLGDSRVDLRLNRASPEGDTTCFVEVKSVTLRDGDVGLFPDAVSERATKHANCLAQAARRGQRTALLFLVQRRDVLKVSTAGCIDPTYAKAVKRAVKAGVELYAAAVDVDDDGISCAGRLPVELA
ncbi:MAG: DNA/RNA nuclease SfsA [Deltaproteobacteria bacterium]|nr:DNA/RNA nuclease SfsA [Deltaproteobacteria bacterium]